MCMHMRVLCARVCTPSSLRHGHMGKRERSRHKSGSEARVLKTSFKLMNDEMTSMANQKPPQMQNSL